jgi:hypothetical protein
MRTKGMATMTMIVIVPEGSGLMGKIRDIIRITNVTQTIKQGGGTATVKVMIDPSTSIQFLRRLTQAKTILSGRDGGTKKTRRGEGTEKIPLRIESLMTIDQRKRETHIC